jgi:hypothetical protein
MILQNKHRYFKTLMSLSPLSCYAEASVKSQKHIKNRLLAQSHSRKINGKKNISNY